jgi:hypothetical protein
MCRDMRPGFISQRVTLLATVLYVVKKGGGIFLFVASHNIQMYQIK